MRFRGKRKVTRDVSIKISRSFVYFQLLHVQREALFAKTISLKMVVVFKDELTVYC